MKIDGDASEHGRTSAGEGNPKPGATIPAEWISMVSSLRDPKSVGVACLLLDHQLKWGRGQPDGPGIHGRLGLTRQAWVGMREDILKLFQVRDGAWTFAIPKTHAGEAGGAAKTRPAARPKTGKAAIGAGDRGGCASDDADGAEASPKGYPTSGGTPAREHDVRISISPIEPAKAKAQKRHSAQSLPIDLSPARRAREAKARLDRLEANGEAEARDPFERVVAREAPPAPDSVPARQAEAAREAPAPTRAAAQNPSGNKPRETGGLTLTSEPRRARGDTLLKITYEAGVGMLMDYGRTETAARQCMAKMLKDWDKGYVVAAIDDAISKRDKVAEPFSWMMAFLRRYPKKADAAMARRPSSEKALGVASAPKAPRAKASPEFLGLSDSMVSSIKRRNAGVGAKFGADGPDDAK